MKIIEAREEHIQIGENDVLVYSHQSVINPDIHIVKLFIGGSELTYHAPSRGEAMVDLADFLKELSGKLRWMALVQEGATGLTVGELYGGKTRG